MKHTVFLLLLVLGLMASCSSKQSESVTGISESDSLIGTLEGDSTVYGLVCDGFTDTILVFLPIDNIRVDPDTFNILNAMRRHRVFGQLKVGDNIAVVRNSQDTTIADYVIDMDDLQNTWCYQELPTLHERADMVGKTEKQKINNLPDSIRELLSVAREYVLQLKADQTVMAKGNFAFQEDENRLVDYPRIKHYGHWNLFNGKLLLSELAFDSLGNAFVASIDTTELLLLKRDTLILRFKDTQRHYYPKKVE
jgi:hypothetical protein